MGKIEKLGPKEETTVRWLINGKKKRNRGKRKKNVQMASQPNQTHAVTMMGPAKNGQNFRVIIIIIITPKENEKKKKKKELN